MFSVELVEVFGIGHFTVNRNFKPDWQADLLGG